MEDPIRESGSHLAHLLAGALRGDGPLYRLLADALKRAIDRGEIPLGTVLPPERSLANELAVSRATVVAAYDRLKADGWLESRQGSGTWVRNTDRIDRKGVDAVATGRLFLGMKGQPSPSPLIEPGGADRDLIELSVAAVTGSPAVAEAVTSLTAEEVTALTSHHGYVPQGLRVLREMVAANFSADGLSTHPDQVIITTGAHQALSLVARQVLKPGNDVLVESPTFPGALDVFRRFNARTIPLPVDEHGARTDILADLINRTEPALIYVAPHFHNPTGAVMSLQRRRELGELAAEHDIVVVEDLALADVAIDDIELPPSIAALVPEATVHTIGSTAKLFWAGMRIGWLRSPDAWSVRMLATKTVADLGSPLLAQLISAKMLERRDEVREQRRAELLPRRELMCQRLNQWLSDWSWQRPAGGLSMWVTLPHGNADEFAELALRHGVAIVPGPSLSVDEGNRQSMRIVFSRPEHDIDEGLRRLATAWERYAEQTSGRATARLLV